MICSLIFLCLQTVPIMWVLMTKKDETAYRSIWKFVKSEFPQFDPTTVVCDFEQALINSARNEFPNAVVQGCLFYYSQVKLHIFFLNILLTCKILIFELGRPFFAKLKSWVSKSRTTRSTTRRVILFLKNL